MNAEYIMRYYACLDWLRHRQTTQAKTRSVDGLKTKT